MQYGERDLKEYVKGATLELKNDGTYVLIVELKNGKTRQSRGNYEVQGETIAFIDKTKKNAPRRIFSRKNDEIEVIDTLHGKTLYFLFSRAGWALRRILKKSKKFYNTACYFLHKVLY